MGKRLIYTHLDVDGITSARIAQHTSRYREAEVKFTPSIFFGVQGLPPNIEEYEEVICLDIGCAQDTVNFLADVASRGVRVILLDHHQPDNPKLISDLQGPNLRIIVDQTHCTASLAYKIFSNLGFFNDPKWPEVWCIVGIYGDVAKDKPGAREVLDQLAPKYPELISQLDCDTNRIWMHQPAGMIARAMNMVRRLAYDAGAKICLNALAEAEKAGDPFILIRDLDYEEWPNYPNIVLMRELIEDYRRMEEDIQHRLIDLDKIGVGIISSKADIGGTIARRGVKKLKKPVFVINDGIVKGFMKLSGRSDTINLVEVLRIAERLSGGKIRGGGHPKAVAGTFPKISFWEVCMYLSRAVREYEKTYSRQENS